MQELSASYICCGISELENLVQYGTSFEQVRPPAKPKSGRTPQSVQADCSPTGSPKSRAFRDLGSDRRARLDPESWVSGPCFVRANPRKIRGRFPQKEQKIARPPNRRI